MKAATQKASAGPPRSATSPRCHTGIKHNRHQNKMGDLYMLGFKAGDQKQARNLRKSDRGAHFEIGII